MEAASGGSGGGAHDRERPLARVALIKPFSGLNLGVSQLSGELQRAGHDSRVVLFKDFRIERLHGDSGMVHADAAFPVYLARGEPWTFCSYRPVTEIEYSLLEDELRGFGAQLVGLSVITAAMSVAAEITERLRRDLGIPVVWGGVGATLETEKALEHADFVCVHEGEQAIVALADAIDRGRPLADVAGIWSRSGVTVRKNPGRPLVNLDDIAIPDFAPSRTIHIEDDRVDRAYRALTFQGQYVIMTTRGCPFSCSFCIESVYQDRFGKKGSLRRRSVDLVMQELVAAKRALDFEHVYFFDDVFTTHRAWLEEFAARYPREVGLPFWCYTYPTTTRPADIELLRDAGCASMTMGVQAASPDLLARFDRPTSLRRVLEAAEIVMSSGIQLFIDMITMSEFETEEDAWANVELLTKLPRGVQMIGLYSMVAFPTYGYTEAVARERPARRMTETEYDYFHKLYFLALSSRDDAVLRAAIRNPDFRRTPSLLDPLLPSEVFIPMIPTTRQPAPGAPRRIDTTGGQGVLAEDLSPHGSMPVLT